MRIKLAIASGALALGLLAFGNAPARNAVAETLPPAKTPDTQTQVAKAKALMASQDEEDFADAVDLWTKLAEQGVPEAQLNLGRLYQYGHSGSLCRDDVKAVGWLSKAAAQGVVEAVRRLGDIYSSADSSLYDPSKAATLYQRGANLDDTESEAALSDLYDQGSGVPKDPAKSIYWLEKAANHPDGVQYAFFLGNQYRGAGDHPAPNQDKAIYWYLQAANGGHGDAQATLAALYEQRGNYFEAYRWYAMVVALEKKTAEFKPVYLQINLRTGGKDPVGIGSAGINEDIRSRDNAAAKLTQEERAKADKWVGQAHMTPVWAVPSLVSSVNERYCPAQASPQK